MPTIEGIGPPAAIPEAFFDLLEGDAVATLVTLRADGTPHVSPVWIDHQVGYLLVNARLDRVKAANMRARSDVAVCVVDPRNTYRYLSVNGIVESANEEGAMKHMDRMAARYAHVDRYPWAVKGERRAIFRIRPVKVFFSAGNVVLPTPLDS